MERGAEVVVSDSIQDQFAPNQLEQLGGLVTATNDTMTAFDRLASGTSQRWYRVALLREPLPFDKNRQPADPAVAFRLAAVLS